MDLGLTGKTALIVGAAGTMGQAVVQAFLAEGAVPIAADLPQRLHLCDRVEVAGVMHAVDVVPMDVTDEHGVREAVRSTIQRHGRIDVLVVLAGVYQAKPIADITGDDWDRLMAINLKGVFLVCRETLPGMKQSDFGRIVLLASLAGQVGGMVAGAHYAASKAGVLSLLKSLVKQTPEPWITVNAVSPGPMEGAMTDAWPEADRRRMIDAIPMRRFARPAEIADAVLFLSSPRAGYIKGARLDLNGGAHLD